MKLEKYNRPFVFYGVSILVPWVLWFVVAKISHTPLWEENSWLIFSGLLMFLGVCVPMITALVLILPDKDMKKELISSLINFKNVNWKWYAFIFLFPFAIILLSQAISLLFGHSTEQFRFAPENMSRGIAFFLVGLPWQLRQFLKNLAGTLTAFIASGGVLIFLIAV